MALCCRDDEQFRATPATSVFFGLHEARVERELLQISAVLRVGLARCHRRQLLEQAKLVRLGQSAQDRAGQIAADLLGRRLGARPSVDPEVAHTWRRTLAGGGRVRVDRLADEVGWSRKRLWSCFRSQLGITPKHAARLVRFDHAARLLAAGRTAADAALRSG
ncbi:helix-turn-helix domain-containing protein [Actinomadura sp. WMMB 499]|uniref:helix-turn-helix domain-containing protein n=1 Tax=Actinomadura sp. WMMB 499 TaxID=1219491 RepID=UPI0034A0C44A